MFRRLATHTALLLLVMTFLAPGLAAAADRQRLNIDRQWSFAFGDANDPAKDFGYGTAPFFFAKAGYGDGPASVKFDDRAWRRLDLPHDWAIEKPFDPRANTNHGSRAVGPGFPQNNVGWYRRTLDIPKSDQGRRIAIEFDGVFRDSTVWFNGHYIGRQPSGYTSFRYDLTDYVTYGGPNVLVVRVDASVEEGWFYEGAGIYRHVWLTKTDPLHVGHWGTYVTTAMRGDDADVTVQTTVDNQDGRQRDFTVEQTVLDDQGKTLATQTAAQTLAAGQSGEFQALLPIPSARLWSIETPTLHKLVTILRAGDQVVDRYETPFGIRTVRFFPDTGFWLNGRNIKLKGSNNHQDHAGLGVALPDALQAYRLGRLKAMGSNAYRASHNPPTPELLEAADRLGMVVIDEHRMMGTTPEIKGQLRDLVRRDRNHPSVVLWSVGNEEWALEHNELGARLTKLMQDYVKTLDPSRHTTLAMSSGSGKAGSTVIDVMGFNYRAQHDVDSYHRDFPNTPALMSEEGSTVATRGVYVADRPAVHLPAYDTPQRPTGSSSIEQGWTAVTARPWMAGMFVWTGFDYRGETTPFGWPAISSQFGMLDTTGQFKDTAYYLKSWWSDAPMAHILPHWTWPGRVGEPIPVWVYSNSEEVELFLNGKSLGRKTMARGSHLEWSVTYAPGTLTARGFTKGKEVVSESVSTAGTAQAIRLLSDRAAIKADGVDVSVVTVSLVDQAGRLSPRAGDLVNFEISGPGKIIGVGNGDPGSHEADTFVDDYAVLPTTGWRLAAPADLAARTQGPPSLDGLEWRDPFQWYPPGEGPSPSDAFILRGSFTAPAPAAGARVSLFLPALTAGQSVFVNGVDLTNQMRRDDYGHAVALGPLMRPGDNEVVIVARSKGQDALNRLNELGIGGRNVAWVQTVTPAESWKRRAFNGYAQVLVQSTGPAGVVTLTASGRGLRGAKLDLRTVATP